MLFLVVLAVFGATRPFGFFWGLWGVFWALICWDPSKLKNGFHFWDLRFFFRFLRYITPLCGCSFDSIIAWHSKNGYSAIFIMCHISMLWHPNVFLSATQLHIRKWILHICTYMHIYGCNISLESENNLDFRNTINFMFWDTLPLNFWPIRKKLVKPIFIHGNTIH